MKVVIDIPEIPTNDKQRWALAHGTPYPYGEWIFTGRKNAYGGSEIECSNCHTKLMVSPSRWEIGENFCDVCGSRNKKEGEAEWKKLKK